MRFCALNKRIVHAMRFLAAKTTRAVSADASVAFDTTVATRKTLAITFVARPDAATVLLATIAVATCCPILSCRSGIMSCRGSSRYCCACHHCLRAVLECANLIGIGWSSACNLRISRTWFLKTFQSVSRALFNNTSCFNAFSHLRTSRSKSANLGSHPCSSYPASDSQLHPGRVQFHGSPPSHQAFPLSAAARLLLPAMFHRCRVQQCRRCLGNGL